MIMKKFSKITENIDKKYYKVIAKVELLIPAENEGEAGYLADSILGGIGEMSEYIIDNISQTENPEKNI
jgi:hypothetical protein